MAIEIAAPHESLETKLQVAARTIFHVLAKKPAGEPLTVGLCGGRSVVGLLGALLAESHAQPQDILSRIHFFMVDERVVPLDDPNSNYGGLYGLFFEKLIRDGLIQPEQLHPFVARMESAPQVCQEYFSELQRFGGEFDVVVLGMGEDGHVAGLFPRHSVLAAQEKGFLSFSDSPKPPPQRMTASVPLVCSSSLAILLALGEGKRAAWEAFQDPANTVADCPACMVHHVDRCLVVTDLVQ
jgi:6-phosphogluconolactonase